MEEVLITIDRIMNGINLANPKMMDIAIPANKKWLTLKQMNQIIK